MLSHLQYITDQHGRQRAVLVPVKDWKALQRHVKKLEEATSFYLTLKEAFAQVESMERTKKKPQTLKEFIDEL